MSLKLTKIIGVLIGVSIFSLLFTAGSIRVNAASEIPVILPRGEWTKNDPSLEKLLTWIPDKSRTAPPDYRPVERIIIHYTDTPNTDNTKEISVARIQAIYQYHAVTNKWGDIGYNYIIDRLGNIYEGRYGGNGVRGAHAFNSITKDNYNVGTIGISLLGAYEKEEPTEAMYASLKKLTAWLAATNGFDPNTSATSKIWNEKSQDFTTTVNLPRIIAHKHIDSTSDSGIPESKHTELRTHSQNYYNEYKNYFYRTGEKMYEITNGEKILILDSAGRTFVNISQTQLDLFPSLKIFKHPSGALIKTNNSGIQLVENNYKRPISNPEIFNSRFKWKDVVVVSRGEWDSYTEGPPVSLKEGMIIRAAGKNEVYVISNGVKRWISGPELFEKQGYKWNNIATVSQSTLEAHLDGEPITNIDIHADGTLITAPGQGAALLANGKKRPIPDPEVFDFNFKWKDLVTVSNSEWSQYAEGEPVYYPDGMILREVNDHKVYLVENGKKRWVTSPVLFSELGYRWDNITAVAPGGTSGMALGDNLSNEFFNIANK